LRHAICGPALTRGCSVPARRNCPLSIDCAPTVPILNRDVQRPSSHPRSDPDLRFEGLSADESMPVLLTANGRVYRLEGRRTCEDRMGRERGPRPIVRTATCDGARVALLRSPILRAGSRKVPRTGTKRQIGLDNQHESTGSTAPVLRSQIARAARVSNGSHQPFSQSVCRTLTPATTQIARVARAIPDPCYVSPPL
jgi:hypothetical protein